MTSNHHASDMRDNSIVERVARALCAAQGLPPSEVDAVWDVWAADAATALEASHHAALVSAGQQMIDDHQTSEHHHPRHVLVPIEAFDAMRSVLAKIGGDA